MVSKGLKVGDTFSEGKLKYKVTGFDSNGNYVSTLVALTDVEAEKPEAVKPITEGETTPETIDTPEAPAEDEYDTMSIRDLQKACKEKGLSGAGKKEDLIKRLREA